MTQEEILNKNLWKVFEESQITCFCRILDISNILKFKSIVIISMFFD